MFLELQLSSSLFTRIVRNRIKSLPLCLDRDLTDFDGTELTIDRIDIGDATSIQRELEIDPASGSLRPAATQVVWIFSPRNYTSVTVPFLQVRQEVSVQLVKRADLVQNGPAPSPIHKTLTIHPVFNVDLSVDNEVAGESGPLAISYKLAYVDLGPLGNLLSGPMRAEVEQLVSGIELPPAALDLGPLTASLGRSVGAVNAGVACDPGGSLVAMRIDFDVHETPPRLDRGFFEAGPRNSLGGREWAMIADADLITRDAARRVRVGLEGSPKLRLNSGPSASWNAAVPAVDIAADIELVDACPFFVDDLDMDVHLTVRSSLAVPAANLLRTHHHIHGEPSDVGEEIACAVTAALLWPFVGAILVDREDINWGKYLGGIALGPVGVLIAALFVIETKQLSQDISQQLGANCSKQGDEDYECNDPLEMRMELVPSLNSRLDLLAVAGVPEGLVLSGGVSNLPELRVGGLDEVVVKPFEWQVLGQCTGNGTNNFRIGNQASISVFCTPPTDMCRAYVIDDPLHEFSIAIDDVNNEITVTANFRLDYAASPDPYPCRVRIVTNRGVRIVTLAPPSPLESTAAEDLERARIASVATCYFADKFHTPQEEMEWIPDPPPFELGPLLQHWQVVARSLSAGSHVQVVSPIAGTILTARPSAHGIAHMTMLFANEQAVPSLTFAVEDQGDAAIELSAQQVLFERRASLPVGGGLAAMRFEGGVRQRRLLIADEAGESTWLVSSAMPGPMLLSSLTRDRRRESELIVNTGKQVRVEPRDALSKRLKRVFDDGVEPEVIHTPRIGALKETLAVRSGEGSVLYDVSRSEPVELQTFAGRAWFEGTALGGDLLARHDPEAGVVHVYAAVARAFR
ncbi:MAG TPA: hypothetical protein VHR18_00580 [Solirubrobacterales bacterium]|jgi:hypothetical protein|nr:hypothetical protein [Solirubrobacterales bacterium]